MVAWSKTSVSLPEGSRNWYKRVIVICFVSKTCCRDDINRNGCKCE